MTGELPEGVGKDDVMEHAATLHNIGVLINRTSAYLDSPDGTAAEVEAEAVLNDTIERLIEQGGPDLAGRMLLAFASLVVAVAPEDAAQAWFDEQGEHIKAALDG